MAAPTYTRILASNLLGIIIAESKRQYLSTVISEAKFFSLMMVGSTDESNADNELSLILPMGWTRKSTPESATYPFIRQQSLEHGLQIDVLAFSLYQRRHAVNW